MNDHIVQLYFLQSRAQNMGKMTQIKKKLTKGTLTEYKMSSCSTIASNNCGLIHWGNYGIWMKESEKLKLQPSTQSSC